MNHNLIFMNQSMVYPHMKCTGLVALKLLYSISKVQLLESSFFSNLENVHVYIHTWRTVCLLAYQLYTSIIINIGVSPAPFNCTRLHSCPTAQLHHWKESCMPCSKILYSVGKGFVKTVQTSFTCIPYSRVFRGYLIFASIII